MRVRTLPSKFQGTLREEKVAEGDSQHFVGRKSTLGAVSQLHTERLLASLSPIFAVCGLQSISFMFRVPCQANHSVLSLLILLSLFFESCDVLWFLWLGLAWLNSWPCRLWLLWQDKFTGFALPALTLPALPALPALPLPSLPGLARAWNLVPTLAFIRLHLLKMHTLLWYSGWRSRSWWSWGRCCRWFALRIDKLLQNETKCFTHFSEMLCLFFFMVAAAQSEWLEESYQCPAVSYICFLDRSCSLPWCSGCGCCRCFELSWLSGSMSLATALSSAQCGNARLSTVASKKRSEKMLKGRFHRSISRVTWKEKGKKTE